ncbi:MAG: type II toxin-antitoxin system YafQ family toxin [Oscillibacter sp.]|nr:type II toxin-antitoxin system YafQ family toxin [Oscillibacter sp.]
MLRTEFSGQFKRDYRLSIKRNRDPALLQAVLMFLVNEMPLPQKYRDHLLVNTRKYKEMRECHIEPDWLLIYKVESNNHILRLIRTGSHSDLF